jgi:hypothetical protein
MNVPTDGAVKAGAAGAVSGSGSDSRKWSAEGPLGLPKLTELSAPASTSYNQKNSRLARRLNGKVAK